MEGYLKFGQKYIIKEGKAIITGNCTQSGKPYKMVLDADQFMRWKNGALIQSAIPSISNEQRTFLTEGVLPGGKNLLFG